MWRGRLNRLVVCPDGGDVDAMHLKVDEALDAGALAHELNNLLDGSLKTVASAARSLRSGGEGVEAAEVEALRRLDTAEALLRRMAGLVETLGRGGHRGRGERGADWGSVPVAAQTLGEAIDEALRGVEAEAAERGVVVDALVDPRLAVLPADALFTVVSNGLRNAMEALAASGGSCGGRIELRLVREGDWAALRVLDDGPGVDVSLKTADGGFRFGATTKANGQGIGLGLSRQVAMALGGELRLLDRLPRGAELLLRFPVSSLRVLVRGGAA